MKSSIATSELEKLQDSAEQPTGPRLKEEDELENLAKLSELDCEVSVFQDTPETQVPQPPSLWSKSCCC